MFGLKRWIALRFFQKEIDVFIEFQVAKIRRHIYNEWSEEKEKSRTGHRCHICSRADDFLNVGDWTSLKTVEMNDIVGGVKIKEESQKRIITMAGYMIDPPKTIRA